MDSPLCKRLAVLLTLLAVASALTFGQTIERGAGWDGYVQRGRVKVRAGGSAWSVNGVSVTHTQEGYDSPDMARHILRRLRGRVRSASELVPNSGSFQYKVTVRKSGTRIAWVCGKDLHYFQSKSYAAAVALLASSGSLNCD
jgi:hypothetical protein